MVIIETYQDIAGKWRYIVELITGETVMWKFAEEQTTTELEALETTYIDQHLYDDLIVLQYELLENIELLREVVTEIKAHPTLNLTQYNAYLDTKTWYEQAIIGFFIFTVAKGLAEHYDKSLANLDETTILVNVRDWIADTPTKKIAKILFGE